MSLGSCPAVGFIPIGDAEAARAFYQERLGLPFVRDDGFALVFQLRHADGMMLRLVRVGKFTPAAFTIFGWEVPSLEDAVKDLTEKGIQFLRFSYLEQDEHGIWRAPGGAKIAWFKDPDGNTLSLSQHTA